MMVQTQQHMIIAMKLERGSQLLQLIGAEAAAGISGDPGIEQHDYPPAE
jgi:hypothetical protein